MATDLAEFLGAALGFNLLFGMPLWLAGILTGIATFLILGLERYGFRPLEAVITGLVGVIAVCYLIETILDRPDWGQVVYHAVVPQFAGTGERAAGHRHPGRDGDAARHLPALGADAGAHRGHANRSTSGGCSASRSSTWWSRWAWPA